MERELKFRAWCAIDQEFKMFTLRDLHLGLVKFDCEIPVTQFTGLRDKNEVDIYEGDILQKIETDYEEWKDLDYEGEQPLKVTKKDYATLESFRFWLKNEEFGYEGEDLENSCEWEIIGNIYENPELLPQSKVATQA